MLIELIDGQCIVTWERVSKPIHDEIVSRLKDVGATFDKPNSCWTLPAKQADRLYDTFPKASYAYETICAVTDAQARRIAIFGQNLLGMGVRLTVTKNRVVAHGDGVSPLLQQCIDDRGENLRVWLQTQNATSGVSRGVGSILGAKPVSSCDRDISNTSSEELHQAELLGKSLRNAAHNQYQHDEMRRRQRRGRAKAKA